MANDKSICLAALFFAFIQEHGKSRDLLDEVTSETINIKITSAWCYLLEVILLALIKSLNMVKGKQKSG